MRTNQKERIENAKVYNTILCQHHKGAIVVEKRNSSNPNIVRTRFWVCNTYGTPVVIAESVSGIGGCFMEYFKNIGYKGKQVEYVDHGFVDWIYKEFGYTIDYKDGLVFMLSCK